MTCSGCAKRLEGYGCWQSALGAAPTAAAARAMATAAATMAAVRVHRMVAPQTRLATLPAQRSLRRPPLACRHRARAPPAHLRRRHVRENDQKNRRQLAKQQSTLKCQPRPHRQTQVRLHVHPSSTVTRIATAATGATMAASTARAQGRRAGVKGARVGAMSVTAARVGAMSVAAASTARAAVKAARAGGVRGARAAATVVALVWATVPTKLDKPPSVIPVTRPALQAMRGAVTRAMRVAATGGVGKREPVTGAASGARMMTMAVKKRTESARSSRSRPQDQGSSLYPSLPPVSRAAHVSLCHSI